MFGRRKEKADITPGEPQFHVRYAGHVETFTGSGRGCTSAHVQKIWDQSRDERKMTKYAMLIVPTGIILTESENKLGKKQERKFDIKRISHYCAAEKGAHERVFAWIYQDPDSTRLFCHAVLCSTREKAQQAAIVLSRAVQIAYKDWKGEKIKMARKNLAGKRSLSADDDPEANYDFHFSLTNTPPGGEIIDPSALSNGSSSASRSSSIHSGSNMSANLGRHDSSDLGQDQRSLQGQISSIDTELSKVRLDGDSDSCVASSPVPV